MMDTTVSCITLPALVDTSTYIHWTSMRLTELEVLEGINCTSDIWNEKNQLVFGVCLPALLEREPLPTLLLRVSPHAGDGLATYVTAPMRRIGDHRE